MNAPALGRQITVVDRIVLTVVSYLAQLCPRAALVPGTPWEALSDEPDLIRKVTSDKLFENGDIRAMTALTLGRVR